MNKVLVSDLLSQRGLDVLAESGDFEVDVSLNLSHEELLDRIADYHALLIRSATRVTAEVIDKARSSDAPESAWTILMCKRQRETAS